MILHVCVLDKFIAPFYGFMKENFDDFDSLHLFYISGDRYQSKYQAPEGKNIYFASSHSRVKRYLWLIKKMRCADKVILHGLFDIRAVQILALSPWLLKKCYWVIWGGDLYEYQLGSRGTRWLWNEIFRRIVIRRMGHFITHIKGDYELAQKWYGAKGEWHECFMYPSNLYKEYDLPYKQGGSINILVGNSADPGNNHLEIFKKLEPYKKENIKIFCPLSYGLSGYARTIEKVGKEMFGDKFVPLLEYMPFEKYLEMLGQVDMAVFAHKRQQAMGNTITLLGLGKKVFMRRNVTSWALFESLGVKIFDLEYFGLSDVDLILPQDNSARIKNYFSESVLTKQLTSIMKG